jgi:hypothetical protein
LGGQVTGARFLGPIRRVTLRLASGRMIVADIPARAAAIGIGDVLSLAPVAPPAIVPR